MTGALAAAVLFAVVVLVVLVVARSGGWDVWAEFAETEGGTDVRNPC